MSLSLRFAAGSHDGMIRDHNEDSGYAGPRLLAVADGMGGQAAGEVASSEVISTIVQLDEDVPGSDVLTALGDAVQRANEQLRVMVEEDPQLEGMGTTLTALLWTGQRLGLVHVGDSRAYLLRDGVLTQITQDHTWVQRLVDEGRITEEEATTHPQRSLLMRALGSGDRVEPDLSIREVRAGDRYLICSDGLSGVVSHQTMEETLASYQGPHDTVEELIQLALRGGGPDNITVIIADVLDVDGGDKAAGQLNDTPVVVGAVAETQHPHGDGPGAQATPASRAAALSRSVPQQPGAGEPEGFGPPGSGTAPGTPESGRGGEFGAPYADASDDGDQPGFRRPRKRGGWFKRGLLIVLALGLLGGGLYAAWKWTRTQYYVGADGDTVALYRGLSQQLGPLDLGEVQDPTGIELKYLPVYQRNQVKENISMGSLAQARDKIEELGEQAEVCEIVEEQRAAAERATQEADQRQPGTDAGQDAGQDSGQDGTEDADAATGGTPAVDDPSPKDPNNPSSAPVLTDEQKRLAKSCRTP
ncbi:Stp1/IreP family PP2C-type Ser/Thr phosphatase [Streptomyces sp. JJ66]|uniref:Stp1/IreP family PP2C-type Ser/Thr phosphatase n=1 Tax=Streptomyces sp. JJ66 TaxID=2803843 RepID=UPI001C55B03A|nr:Stp1/IreP family PP2C-type Ser/Thr phosphatase [Streptomyces sp. JJ66]MBW1601812.1 Stp1/IreP family PP2C-type Ser/Thr phosphatase [Streptomyces sp. JJ66]